MILLLKYVCLIVIAESFSDFIFLKLICKIIEVIYIHLYIPVETSKLKTSL